MNVTNTSGARVRITDPHGWVDDGASVDVPDAYGRGLIDQGGFTAAKPKNKPSAPDALPAEKEKD